MKIKKAWKLIRKINSDEIQFGDLSEKEKEGLLKAVFKLARRHVILSRIWMMRDVIKWIAVILIVLLGVDIIVDLIRLFTNS
jgi:hypothetical protein